MSTQKAGSKRKLDDIYRLFQDILATEERVLERKRIEEEEAVGVLFRTRSVASRSPRGRSTRRQQQLEEMRSDRQKLVDKLAAERKKFLDGLPSECKQELEGMADEGQRNLEKLADEIGKSVEKQAAQLDAAHLECGVEWSVSVYGEPKLGISGGQETIGEDEDVLATSLSKLPSPSKSASIEQLQQQRLGAGAAPISIDSESQSRDEAAKDEASSAEQPSAAWEDESDDEQTLVPEGYKLQNYKKWVPLVENDLKPYLPNNLQAVEAMEDLFGKNGENCQQVYNQITEHDWEDVKKKSGLNFDSQAFLRLLGTFVSHPSFSKRYCIPDHWAYSIYEACRGALQDAYEDESWDISYVWEYYHEGYTVPYRYL